MVCEVGGELAGRQYGFQAGVDMRWLTHTSGAGHFSRGGQVRTSLLVGALVHLVDVRVIVTRRRYERRRGSVWLGDRRHDDPARSFEGGKPQITRYGRFGPTVSNLHPPQSAEVALTA